MYSQYEWRTLLHNAKNPRRVLLEFYKLWHRKILAKDGISIPETDWDNLLILDACRYDMFDKYNTIGGELTSVISAASATEEFLSKNFNGGEFPEIVYVSANPNLRFVDAKFHKRIRLWNDYWDEELRTLPPDVVTEKAIEATSEYPNKRLIVHYMQPHYPFIGDTGEQLRANNPIQHYSSGDEFWRQLSDPEINTDDFINAYHENLKIALPAVNDLAGQLYGKTVVTSDHGNEYGKWGIYGHPAELFTEGLVRVPWLITEPTNNRKDITPGKATDGPETDDHNVDQILADLGYK